MKWYVIDRTSNEPVGKAYRNRTRAENYCDDLNRHSPGTYFLRYC